MAGKKVLVGAASWLALAALLGGAALSLDEDARARVRRVRAEASHLFVDPPRYTALFPTGTWIERGDGVFAVIDGKLDRIGQVVRIRGGDGHALEPKFPEPLLATFELDHRVAEFRPTAGTVAVRRSQSRSFLFAAKTLLPEARLRRIESEWATFRALHADSIERELAPLAASLLSTTMKAVAAELPSALDRHRADVDRIVRRLREGLVREQVTPLLAEELLPIVTRSAGPLAETIGRELWDKVPLMSFALRAAADRVLEDHPVRVEERWRKFVDEEAVPTLRAHQPEIEQALGAIVRDALASDALQERTATAWRALQADPAVAALERDLLRELLVENARVTAALKTLADDPSVKERLARVGAQLEEFLDPIGELLFLDETGKGINPDLAYLIRLLLLRRDAQMVVLDPGPAGGAVLPDGSQLEGRHEQ